MTKLDEMANIEIYFLYIFNFNFTRNVVGLNICCKPSKIHLALDGIEWWYSEQGATETIATCRVNGICVSLAIPLRRAPQLLQQYVAKKLRARFLSFSG